MRTSILASIQSSGLIRFPQKTNKVMGKDEEAYCKLHDTYGHSTEKCHDLMNQIEALIWEGKLERFQAWKNDKITTLEREEGMVTKGMMIAIHMIIVVMSEGMIIGIKKRGVMEGPKVKEE